MKKLISIVALASALALVGCKKKEEKNQAPKVEDKGTATATAGTAAATGTAPATGTDPGTAAATGGTAGTAAATGAADPGHADHGGHAVATGSADCDAYIKAFDDFSAKCKDKLGAAYEGMKTARDSQLKSFESWAAMDEATKKAAMDNAGASCKTGTESLKTQAKTLGCEF